MEIEGTLVTEGTEETLRILATERTVGTEGTQEDWGQKEQRQHW